MQWFILCLFILLPVLGLVCLGVIPAIAICVVLFTVLYLLGYWDGNRICSKQNNPDFLSADSDSFAKVWRSMSEKRRRNNTGIFVQKYNRPPTETEIQTGEINETN
jgi:hypothetical protein